MFLQVYSCPCWWSCWQHSSPGWRAQLFDDLRRHHSDKQGVCGSLVVVGSPGPIAPYGWASHRQHAVQAAPRAEQVGAGGTGDPVVGHRPSQHAQLGCVSHLPCRRCQGGGTWDPKRMAAALASMSSSAEIGLDFFLCTRVSPPDSIAVTALGTPRTGPAKFP